MKATTSYFFVGLTVGVLLSTSVFAFVLRGTQANGEGPSSQARVLKLAHSLDQSHPVHLAMLRMADLVANKSGQTVKLQVIPNGQLGSETECIEQVLSGALAMTKTSTAALEGFVPSIRVFGIPYLFRDEAHCNRVLDGPVGRRLLEAGAPTGLRGLCFYDAGARSFYTIDTPVIKPEDLQGLKIRVQKSKTSMDMVTALGGSPTPIPWGELYTALQQNMVDGAENNVPSFFANRHFEVCKHLSLDEHTRVPDILIFSEKVWANLPPDVQAWLKEAADESAAFQRVLWKTKTEEAKRAVQEAGVTIHSPDKEAFATKTAELRKEFETGELAEMIREIQATR